jgi:hypothetical protein
VKIEWIALADGVGQDSRGAFTAIALNQNVFPTPTLPSAAKRAVIVHVAEEPGVLKPGDKFNILFNVFNPHGKVINAQSGQVAIGPVQWPNLPMTADLPAEMILNVSEYGTYRIEAAVQPMDGKEDSKSIEFYVVEAPSIRLDQDPASPAS